MKKLPILAVVLAVISVISAGACQEAPAVSSVPSALKAEHTAPVVEISHPAVQEIREKPLEHKAHTVKIETILQHPELPTGCESVSLAMVMNARGIPTSKTEIADQYMPTGDGFVTTFQGDPRSFSGMGIYPPGLVQTAEFYLRDKKSSMEAVDLTGMPLEDLFKLIDHDYPIVIWITGGLYPPSAVQGEGGRETYQGREYQWYNNIHCVVLSGYDTEKQTVTVNDPLSKDVKIYDAGQFGNVYNKTDRMAMTVI